MADHPERTAALPEPMRAVRNERDGLLRMLDALDATADPVERADLATSIVGAAARYENIKQAAVPSTLGGVEGIQPALDHAEADRQALREALKDVHGRTRNVKPLNAHMDDPEGFERALASMVAAIRAHLDREAKELLPLVEGMDPLDGDRLSDKLRSVARHATSLPDPPSNPLRRKIAELGEAIERAVGDESTPWHPGTRHVEQNGPAEGAG